MSTRSHCGRRAFTLVEIMIVVLVVGILSTLTVATIGRIKEKTIKAALQNNLRQIYQAKEFYFAEKGASGATIWVNTLVKEGYLKQSFYDRVFSNSHQGMEFQAGWHYSFTIAADGGAQAYRGSTSNKPSLGAPASEDIIYYPAP